MPPCGVGAAHTAALPTMMPPRPMPKQMVLAWCAHRARGRCDSDMGHRPSPPLTAGHMHIGAGAARAPALPAEPQRVENGRGHVAAMDYPVALIH